MRIGVYPGTFDPITLGHMDIIRRGAKLVDRLVIGVTTNITKSPLFDDDERIETVFLMADVGLQPIASRLVKEIAIFGGEIRKFVTPAVRDAVVARIADRGLRQGDG
jgi:cytidyltransferase-like protein